MKTLILSFNTYDWIFYCSDKVKENPKSYEVMIVCNDNDKPIALFPKLCKEARYLQRKNDIEKVGKTLKLQKIHNLRMNDGCIDIEKLMVSIQLSVIIGGIKKIIYQNVDILNQLIPKICKLLNINCINFDEFSSRKLVEFELIGLP